MTGSRRCGSCTECLRPDGALVLSRQHPTGDWLRHGGDYFDVRVIAETWSKGWKVRYWLAPLEVTCAEIAAAGFLIERLEEPRPAPEACRDFLTRMTTSGCAVSRAGSRSAFRLRPATGQSPS